MTFSLFLGFVAFTLMALAFFWSSNGLTNCVIKTILFAETIGVVIHLLTATNVIAVLAK